ncbi:MAG: exosortase/archaeosortase family protein [Chloroflexota bacterium]
MNLLNRPPNNSGSTQTQQWLFLGMVVAIFVLLTWPIWDWLWREWMSNEYYSHGILIVPISLYLIWRRFQNQSQDKSVAADEQSHDPLSGGMMGIFLLVASLVLYLYWYNDKAYYLAAFAAIGMVTGLVWVLGGPRWLMHFAFPIGYLLLMVPLPFIERVTLPLALFTGVCSTALVKLLGIELTVIGNAVKLPNADLLIGAQCSGVNSMMALIALLTLGAYVLKGPLWGRLALVLSAVPLAMIGNIIRVSNLIVVARYWGADAAFTFYHDYSGIVFFVLILLLLLPLTKMLRCTTLRLEVL